MVVVRQLPGYGLCKLPSMAEQVINRNETNAYRRDITMYFRANMQSLLYTIVHSFICLALLLMAKPTLAAIATYL